ncbi:MAG: PIN domain-containing protein [Candidatus Methanoperedens sp.]|nr:PIN domain-containing protein [Candidatus Methanoperedens sp.]
MKYDKFVFLDTAYAYALINTRDRCHEKAVIWQERLAKERKLLLSTEFVLVEIADGLAAVKFHKHAVQIINLLKENPFVEIVPLSSELLEEAFKLYKKRTDKGWGLTDCTSFIVMKHYGIMDALTTDEHFQQAGFRALLREDA